MDFDNTDQVRALAALPPEPPKREERSAWGAPWRAIKAGAAEVIGSVADVSKAYGAASALNAEASMLGRNDTTSARAVGDEARRQFDTGEALSSGVGDDMRQISRSLRPDPATAGVAEQIVFGAVRPVVKLVGAGLAMGPAGLGLASAEEGFTQADELRLQGVDLATRTKVGALTAGATAAGAALPLVGPTLKTTAGLYLLGGPGAFMAQQAATRSILERANYADLARQYDPLDPLGLAVSALLPLPFAAKGVMRNVRALRAADAPPRVEPTLHGEPAAAEPHVPGVAAAAEPPTAGAAPHAPLEVVDAAMAHNLTALQDARDAVQQEGGPVAVARAQLQDQIAGLEEERAGLLGDASNLAEKGAIRTARQELKVLESQRPQDTPETVRARAKEIQASEDRVSYKAALSRAEKEFEQRIADHDARVERLRQVIETNARAQQAVQRVGEIDKQIAALRQGMEAPQRTEATPAPRPAARPQADPTSVTQPAAREAAAPLTAQRLTGVDAPLRDGTADHLQAVAARVQQAESEAGHLVVRHEESGKPVTLADELARIRREAAEGTDSELGTLDADLVKVAATCALTHPN